jgi:tripartite-type tricarboxylate transporter receptor subunit TctC
MRVLPATIAAALLCAASNFALAADYPDKPIRFIVNFPPGGTADILARLIGPKLGDTFKQQIVIDNRVGASGNIGAGAVAKAAPDGYTIGMFTSIQAISPALFTRSPFDPVKDFTPITRLISVANLISVHPSVPATTLTELIALAKAQPGKLSFGSAGTGTAVHLTGELLKSVANIDMTHIPYKGGGPAITDLVGGQVPVGIQNISTIINHVRAGRVRALGISSLERSPALPDVPTVASVGFPGFEANEWYGLVAPPATPSPIIATLHREIVRIMTSPEMSARMLDQGAVMVADSPEDFGTFIRNELAKWSKIARESGIKLE